jgi:hypothetical protein
MATLPAWSNAALRPIRRASWRCRYSPRVIPATAGPNTSPTTEIALFPISTGQNDGITKIVTAPAARTANAVTINPRFAWVASMVAPATGSAARPSQPPIIVTNPTPA